MRPSPSLRGLRAGVALLFLAGTLAACGGAGTGDGAGSAAAAKASAAPAAPVAAAPAAPKFLVLQGDTVRSPEGLTDDQKTFLSCTQQNRFAVGSRIVWRFVALDPITNKALDDKQLKSMVLTLPDGKTDVFKYGGHGGTKENPAQSFWTAGFSVPQNYPTGVFNFKITATSTEGAVGTWTTDQFKVPAAQLVIVPASLRATPQ